MPIQAAVGKRVIARETLSAMRADVTAGLYGGKFAFRAVTVHRAHAPAHIAPETAVLPPASRDTTSLTRQFVNLHRPL